MAKYNVGPKGCVPKDGEKLPPFAERVVADDFRPGREWTPLDAAAVAAFEKRYGPNAVIKSDPENKKRVAAERKENASILAACRKRLSGSSVAPAPSEPSRPLSGFGLDVDQPAVQKPATGLNAKPEPSKPGEKK